MERRNQVTAVEMARGRAMEARAFESANCGGDKMVWAEVARAWDAVAEELARAHRVRAGAPLPGVEATLALFGPVRALEARALARAA